MIVTKIIGGLGNQMFQYAAGKLLAIDNNCELKLDISGYDFISSHNGYELNIFNIDAETANEREIANIIGLNNSIITPIRKKLHFTNKNHIIEKQFEFDPTFKKIVSPAYLDGYWQSIKYVEPVWSALKNEFTFKSGVNELNHAIVDQINNVNSVSIHIRRGDYISNPSANKMHGFIGLEYYRDAIFYMKSHIPSPYFFVFSDDVLWAKENLNLSDDVYFVSNNTGVSSFVDMQLMSNCKHNIIANSSFSWWGAWLGTNTDKIVIYPQNWFSSKKIDLSSLCPNKWICIP